MLKLIGFAVVVIVTLSTAASNSAAAQLFDYPGAYSQRWDGVEEASKRRFKSQVKTSNRKVEIDKLKPGLTVRGPLWNSKSKTTAR